MNKGKSLLQGNLEEVLNNYSKNKDHAKTLNDIFVDKVGEAYE